MKILQVMAGAAHGGAETAFVDMCVALHEAGENILVVTRANKIRVPRLRVAGIPVHTAPFGGKIDIYTPWRLAKIIRGFEPDIVQTWMSRAAEKTPRWDESMNVPRYAVVSRLGGYYKLRHFKSADYFVAITPDIKRFLVTEGVPEDRARVIHNFAETEEAAAAVSRADMDTPDGAPLLLALGRLHESKAFDVLIEAVADMPGIYLWIAGEGPERKRLETLIARRGVAERIKLLGWRTDRAALLKACDICVFPSRYEPFGVVFAQAWAQARPVIASAADGPRQFIKDGEDGLMFPVDDREALKARIAALAADQDLAARIAAAGFARYEAEFTKARTVAGYLEFYHAILNSLPKGESSPRI